MHGDHFISTKKKTEPLDSYITCIRQVATLLGYGIRSFQKHTAAKIILGTLSHRILIISSRISQMNPNKTKDR